MQKPPYNAHLVIGPFPNVVYNVTFSTFLPANVTADQYNLANFEARSGAGAVISNNHFHDGFSRMALLKAINMTYTNNLGRIIQPYRLSCLSF